MFLKTRLFPEDVYFLIWGTRPRGRRGLWHLYWHFWTSSCALLDLFLAPFEILAFCIDFSSLLARFCIPTWLPKSTKIDQNSMPRCIVFCTVFFDRFLVHFCSQLGPVGSQKTLFFLRKNKVFCKIAFPS